MRELKVQDLKDRFLLDTAMPIANVNQLSDEEPPAKPGSTPPATAAAAEAEVLPPEPTPKVVTKPKAKAKGKGKAKSCPKPVAKPVPQPSGVMRRPAAAPAIPKASCRKRPASTPKVNKYIYHRDGVWGIKVDGSELIRVGVQNMAMF